jgi:type I restriction enzyme S subunit
MKIADSLRKSVLQAAIQGKLTEQLSTRATLPIYLAKSARKSPPDKGRQTEKRNTAAPISDDEIPFDIPENWTWCRLGKLVVKSIWYTASAHRWKYKLLRIY